VGGHQSSPIAPLLNFLLPLFLQHAAATRNTLTRKPPRLTCFASPDLPFTISSCCCTSSTSYVTNRAHLLCLFQPPCCLLYLGLCQPQQGAAWERPLSSLEHGKAPVLGQLKLGQRMVIPDLQQQRYSDSVLYNEPGSNELLSIAREHKISDGYRALLAWQSRGYITCLMGIPNAVLGL
jgi:hypothetical protein